MRCPHILEHLSIWSPVQGRCGFAGESMFLGAGFECSEIPTISDLFSVFSDCSLWCSFHQHCQHCEGGQASRRVPGSLISLSQTLRMGNTIPITEKHLNGSLWPDMGGCRSQMTTVGYQRQSGRLNKWTHTELCDYWLVFTDQSKLISLSGCF